METKEAIKAKIQSFLRSIDGGAEPLPQSLLEYIVTLDVPGVKDLQDIIKKEQELIQSIDSRGSDLASPDEKN